MGKRYTHACVACRIGSTLLCADNVLYGSYALRAHAPVNRLDFHVHDTTCVSYARVFTALFCCCLRCGDPVWLPDLRQLHQQLAEESIRHVQGNTERDRQTDRQTERERERETERERERETETETETESVCVGNTRILVLLCYCHLPLDHNGASSICFYQSSVLSILVTPASVGCA